MIDQPVILFSHEKFIKGDMYFFLRISAFRFLRREIKIVFNLWVLHQNYLFVISVIIWTRCSVALLYFFKKLNIYKKSLLNHCYCSLSLIQKLAVWLRISFFWVMETIRLGVFVLKRFRNFFPPFRILLSLWR